MMRIIAQWVIRIGAFIVAAVVYGVWKQLDRELGIGGFLSGALRGALIAGFIAWVLVATRKFGAKSKIAVAPSNAADSRGDAHSIDAIYEEIDQELRTDTVDRATWTRAQGDAEGNAERAKALYIKYRAQRLLAASRDESGHQATVDVLSAEKPAKKYNSRFVVTTAGVLVCAVLAVIVIGFFTEKPAPAKGGWVPLGLTKGGFEDMSHLLPPTKPDLSQGDRLAMPDDESALQLEALDHEVPDWRSIVGGKGSKSAYRQWLSKQPPEYQQELNASNSAAVIARSIAKFNAEAAKAAVPRRPKS